MIDWVTCELPCRHVPLNAGAVMKVAADGCLEWHSPCRVRVEGSHESGVQVRSIGTIDAQGRASTLWFSGNPSKFLQGHNVFGSDDLVALMLDTYLKVLASLDIVPNLDDLKQVKQGAYPLMSVDINQSFDLPSRSDVLAWIRAAEYKSKTRHGRPSMKGGTLYWGKSSQRWALKVYSKGEEIEAPKHRLPSAFNNTYLAKWADTKLRLELRIKKKQLRELNIETASQMTLAAVKRIYQTYVEKIEMNEQIALSDEQQMNLPRGLCSTYILWKQGHDLRSILPKNTYYRHRRALMEQGIDIAFCQESIEKTNVIPLLKVLEAQPASIPDWAFNQNLVHHSARL
ncbi:phage/plasmid replication protein, II/X family [Reinekea blandensis]|uniref:Replication-associated protein G2P N-terminal domain-containing protein n=1 Tax=Reinekea blandensis MED297 TaxID=314283 RepID=A4BDT9_9GAMM|nr:phage/plasmid replication protein, II/X family [Reinekea blandensis]EAR09698.1 hypothetical protein MED297_16104 [Reinekea blandensis MED297]